jgi:Ca2+-binding RTX toxin-like protein
MFGLNIQAGHTNGSLMINGQECTKEAKITQEQGCFGQPTKTVIDAGNGDDTINVHTNFDGSVDVNINGETYSFSAEEAKNLEIRGGKGNDTIVCTGEAFNFEIFGTKFGADNPNLTIDGGKGDDLIVGSEGNDTIRGGKGNDVIMGGGGNDNIDGGRGNDLITGGNGHDTIQGGRGSDTIMGGEGNDTIHGGYGNDNIHGGNGNDNVYGDQGRDNVYGGEGKDWVQGGSKERNFLEELFDMPSRQDSVNERGFFDRILQGLRG